MSGDTAVIKSFLACETITCHAVYEPRILHFSAFITAVLVIKTVDTTYFIEQGVQEYSAVSCCLASQTLPRESLASEIIVSCDVTGIYWEYTKFFPSYKPVMLLVYTGNTPSFEDFPKLQNLFHILNSPCYYSYFWGCGIG